MSERLWAPWRMEYVTRPSTGTSEATDFFLDLPAGEDEAGLIVYRGETAFVLLNAFPYNAGHLLIAPYRQEPSLSGLTAAEATEIHGLLARSIDVLTAVYRPAGFNVGLNLGSAAGAGVPSHLHWHVVPRWPADANFMTVTGETRVLPEALPETWHRLRTAWPTP